VALGGWREKEADWVGRLPERWKSYLRWQPSRGWRQGEKTRSEVEAAIVYRWISDGASDRQIIELADSYLPRQIEERPKRGHDYIKRTIDKMRWWAYERGGVISSPAGGKPRQREATYRHTCGDDLEAALELVQGQPHADWIRELQASGRSRSTAYRNSTRLQRMAMISVAEGRVRRQANEQDEPLDEVTVDKSGKCCVAGTHNGLGPRCSAASALRRSSRRSRARRWAAEHAEAEVLEQGGPPRALGDGQAAADRQRERGERGELVGGRLEGQKLVQPERHGGPAARRCSRVGADELLGPLGGTE
jgi:hypothetical protein